MKPVKVLCCMFLFTLFVLGLAQNTIVLLLFLIEELSNRKCFMHSAFHAQCTSVTQKIVHGHGPPNINLRLCLFVPLIFVRFITIFPSINYVHA